MKQKLHSFFDQLCIKNKIIVACIPFLLISYIILFLSITLIMYNQMKTMIYEQTQQNIIAKANLLNATLKNYDQLTTNYLYYTKDIQKYLLTNQSQLTKEQTQLLNHTLASHTTTLITDNEPSITRVSLFNQYGDLYTNNAIYSTTIEDLQNYAKTIHSLASDYHGKLVICDNPLKPQTLTIARTVYVPTLEQSDEEIGFLLLEISRSSLEHQLNVTQNSDAVYMLLTDEQGKIILNTSNLTDEECSKILNTASDTHYTVEKRKLSYCGCHVTSIIDESILFANTYSKFTIVIFFMFISIFIILLAIVYSGNMISSQVSCFIQKLNQTSEINQNAYITVTSKDEFQELGLVYNNMISRIDNLIHTVYLKELLTKNAQLESLQAQINPHFLYNTLDCINSLAEIGEKEKVQKVVTSLANIMRMSIKGNTFITLKEDLSYIEQYIYIQKMRFQDKILFLIEVPESIYKYYIPKLTLQPLVENAIIHGVSELDETGMIGIFGSEDEKNIYISIKDNGSGMPKEIINQLNLTNDSDTVSNKHIGIFNIQKKLHILYGKYYGLNISSIKPHGTNVTICIPKSLEPHRKENLNETINC